MKNLNNRKAHQTKPGLMVMAMVILTAFMIMIIALALAFSSLNSHQAAFYQNRGSGVFFHMDGCMEEALAKLNRNNIYTGGTISLGTTTCVIVVGGTDPNRTLTVTATDDGYTRKAQAAVTIFPTYVLTSWQEIVN